MKNLNSFKEFELSKAQMNAVNGGALYHCAVVYTDEYGGSHVRTIESEMTLKEVQAAIEAQVPDAIVTCM